ncbi:MAG: nucleoside hydrolase [Bacteroides sp.]|nr:nucleoside hydrolase [Bacteroides sp.]
MIHISHISYYIFVCLLFFCVGCRGKKASVAEERKIDLIFDTDANNALDDQHALAYLLLNDGVFNVLGITTNATSAGGTIADNDKEAARVIALCNKEADVRLLTGAQGTFEDIQDSLDTTDYDGHQAVNFIIEQARRYSEENKLLVLAVGKLTNVALAVKKDTSIVSKIRLVWLGSNYPQPGEYNLVNDIPSVNYLLESGIHFELVPARYGEPSGTAAVKVSMDEMRKKMQGAGPQAAKPVVGRYGGSFHCFGDYSVNLFEHSRHYGDGSMVALFDMATVAIVKNPMWAHSKPIPCPIVKDKEWVERPDNPHTLTLWENFSRDSILNDFYATFR